MADPSAGGGTAGGCGPGGTPQGRWTTTPMTAVQSWSSRYRATRRTTSAAPLAAAPGPAGGPAAGALGRPPEGGEPGDHLGPGRGDLVDQSVTQLPQQ